MKHNVYVYGKLRVCVRGFSEGKSEASKRATNFGLAKTSNFFYTVLWVVIILFFFSLLNQTHLEHKYFQNSFRQMLLHQFRGC